MDAKCQRILDPVVDPCSRIVDGGSQERRESLGIEHNCDGNHRQRGKAKEPDAHKSGIVEVQVGGGDIVNALLQHLLVHLHLVGMQGRGFTYLQQYFRYWGARVVYNILTAIWRTTVGLK